MMNDALIQALLIDAGTIMVTFLWWILFKI
jgi:hypothetical protein